MDILRRNTDYALRLVVNLAKRGADGLATTRVLAAEEKVSYQLACKLMQELHRARLVESVMGPKGGFRLARAPGRISVLKVIEAIQGPLSLNRCLLRDSQCPRKQQCPVRSRLAELQHQMVEYLGGVTLGELVASRPANDAKKTRKVKSSVGRHT